MISFVARPLYSDLVFSDMGVVAAEVADPPVPHGAARTSIYSRLSTHGVVCRETAAWACSGIPDTVRAGP
jgi:hypothetical protein